MIEKYARRRVPSRLSFPRKTQPRAPKRHFYPRRSEVARKTVPEAPTPAPANYHWREIRKGDYDQSSNLFETKDSMFRLKLLVTLLLSVLLSACGPKPPAGAKPTKKVTVTVTYKGTPVGGAVVTFVNQDGPPSANGRTDAQGKAPLKTYIDGDGATLGSHKVMIEKSVAEGGQNVDQDSPQYNPNAPPAIVKYLIPQKYSSIATSGLTAEVKEGGPAEFKFDLKD
jgi:hypothetical protein